MSETKKRKVIFCVPVYPKRPHQATLDSLRDSVPVIEAAGWDHGLVHEIGCPYISAARATMLRKALDAKADAIVFIDSDVSWRPSDMLKLLETDGDVVAGTYRFKKDDEEYMGSIKSDGLGRPLVRQSDGAISAVAVPAGFLRVTRAAVNLLMEKYPELCYGEQCSPSFDLFQHGAHQRVYYGEDFAFCRRWTDLGQDIWLLPDVGLDHHGAEGRQGEESQVWRGNFHRFLLKQPGGSESSNPKDPREILREGVSQSRGRSSSSRAPRVGAVAQHLRAQSRRPSRLRRAPRKPLDYPQA